MYIGWVPNKHLSVFIQSYDVINIVLSNEDDQQRSSDTGYRKSPQLVWHDCGGFLNKHVLSMKWLVSIWVP